MADDNGNIKRLNNYEIKFEIEGPGELVADAKELHQSPPRIVGHGSRPGQSHHDTGEIKVRGVGRMGG